LGGYTCGIFSEWKRFFSLFSKKFTVEETSREQTVPNFRKPPELGLPAPRDHKVKIVKSRSLP
jgi:hypothetical protein